MKQLQAKSQCSKLLGHLMRYGSITRGQAFARYGVANLWQRMRELEKRGHEIDRKHRVRVGGTYVTRYSLIPARKH